MLIASYNKKQLGDVLLVIIAQDVATQAAITKGKITQIYDVKTKQTLGYNFFNVSEILPNIEGDGPVKLTKDDVEALNQALSQAKFDTMLAVDLEPKFVVGYVTSLEEHPDSDHLHIAQVQIDGQRTVQIVCGAPNIELHQRVVVAKSGAMMPNGALIWPGALRGVSSAGMLCSARELALPHAPQKRGILVLPESFEIGTAFDFAKAAQLFTPTN